MAAPNVPLNIPTRKSKSLIQHFGCQVAPFYKISVVAPEGAPVQIKSGATDEVELVTAGSAPSGTVLGLLAQEVYDASVLGELSGYDFHNTTKARTGDTVGVLTGQGWVLTKNYTGAVANADSIYPAASGKLSATQTGSDERIAVSEGAGTDGDTLVRMRVDFKIV
jgi:hypothetical protein